MLGKCHLVCIISQLWIKEQTSDKTETKHRLSEIDANITNGVIFFTHHEQYYIDIHV
jgi:sulfur transfer protein SufE